MLGFILVAFVAMWSPFFVSYVTAAVGGEAYRLSDAVETAFVWLGYASSMVNPFIYSMINISFRSAFKKIITLAYCRKRLKHKKEMSRLYR